MIYDALVVRECTPPASLTLPACVRCTVSMKRRYEGAPTIPVNPSESNPSPHPEPRSRRTRKRDLSQVPEDILSFACEIFRRKFEKRIALDFRITLTVSTPFGEFSGISLKFSLIFFSLKAVRTIGSIA